jgi:AcrR family transcriptional regulator
MAMGASQLTVAVARRSLERSMAQRGTSYVQEVQHIVDATYAVIARTGSFDPKLRDILAESGLSTQAFYKHFRSKDELMLVLLDDGRRRLVGYLTHLMDKVDTPAEKIRAWIEGVLAQALDADVAARTRPFVAYQDRLAEQFPEEQQQSVNLLIGLLSAVIGDLPGARSKLSVSRDAKAIYELSFGTLHWHLSHGTHPSHAEANHLVEFSLRGVGAL